MAGCGHFVSDTIIDDQFWAKLRETVRMEGIPYQWEALNDRVPGAVPSHCMKNFRIAAKKEAGDFGGYVFQDSDVAKWLEGVANSLVWHPDPRLEEIADGAIDEIVAAQQPDGYLDTYYIINGLDKRWTNLMDHHELYCAGHMIEAAVAYYKATGKRKLLDAMIRLVEHIDSVFGAGEGKLPGYPGHPVIEMALIRLYDVTGDERPLKLAEYFINQRGQAPLYFEEESKRNGNTCSWKASPLGYQYYQAGRPVREQKDAEGHAVRAMYLYSGMADVARLTGDASLREACETVWRSVTGRRMYITGSIGSSAFGESFTFDYDLPNDTVYGETCAAIGLVFFARRMLELEAKGEYADVMERALYNGVISGMQQDGKKFFYVNPLEVLPVACEKDSHKRHVKYERQPWFGCSCCPPNLVRLVTSLEQYIYSSSEDSLYVHLYVNGNAKLTMGAGEIGIQSRTRYPWDGDIAFKLGMGNPQSFSLKLRIPGWCRDYSLTVNGTPCACQADNGYACIRRQWKDGDLVQLHISMPVMIYKANPRVAEDAGKVAVGRGPIVYCLEEADNGPDLHLVRMAGASPEDFSVKFEFNLLGGTVALASPGVREDCDGWDVGALYACNHPVHSRPVTLSWIPYFLWANRGAGEMRVWVRE